MAHDPQKNLNLKTILSSCKLTPASASAEPTLISKVDLSCHRLRSFESGSLSLLLNLHSLNLAGNRDLFANDVNFTNTNEITTSSTSLRDLFINLGRLPSLRDLNLSSNELSIFPDDLPLGSFSSLETLNLSFNVLSSKNALSGLCGLSSLSVNLRELDLSRNALCSPLPKEIAHLQGLEVLILDECHIGSFDSSSSTMSSAEFDTNLMGYSTTLNNKQSEDDLLLLSTLPSLLRLSLSKNYLTSLPTMCSKGFNKLQHLNVSHNLLSVDCNLILLFSLPNLKEVEIFGNPCAEKAAMLQGEIYRSESAATWAHTTSLTRMYESYPGSISAPRSMRSMSPNEKRTRDSPSPYAQQTLMYSSSSSSSSSNNYLQRGLSPIPTPLPSPPSSSSPQRIITMTMNMNDSSEINAGITPSGSIFFDETIDAIKDLAEASIDLKHHHRIKKGSQSQSRSASPTTAPRSVSPPRTFSSVVEPFVGQARTSISSSSPVRGRPLSRNQQSSADIVQVQEKEAVETDAERRGTQQHPQQPEKRLLKIILEDRPRPPAEILKDRARSSSPPLSSSMLRPVTVSNPQDIQSNDDFAHVQKQSRLLDTNVRPTTVPALATRRSLPGMLKTKESLSTDDGVTSIIRSPPIYQMRKKMLKVTPIKVLETVKLMKQQRPPSSPSLTRSSGTHPPFSAGFRKVEGDLKILYHRPSTSASASSSSSLLRSSAISSPSSTRRYAILSQFELPGFLSSSSSSTLANSDLKSSSSTSPFKTSTGEYLDPEAEALYNTLSGSNNIFAKVKKHKEKRDSVRRLTGKGYYSSDRNGNAVVPQPPSSSSSRINDSYITTVSQSEYTQHRSGGSGGSSSGWTATAATVPLGNILEFGDDREDEEDEEEEEGEEEGEKEENREDDNVEVGMGREYLLSRSNGGNGGDTSLPRSFLRSNQVNEEHGRGGGGDGAGGGKRAETENSEFLMANNSKYDGDSVFENGDDDFFVDDASVTDRKLSKVTNSATLSSFPNPPLVAVSATLRTAMAAAFADVTDNENNTNNLSSRTGTAMNNGGNSTSRSNYGVAYDATSAAALNAAARFRNPSTSSLNVAGNSGGPLDAGNSVASSSVLLGGLQMGASTARSLFAGSSTYSVGGGGRGGVIGGGVNNSSSNSRSLHLYKTALHGLRDSLKRNTNSFEGTTSFLMKGPTAIQRARQRPLMGYIAHGSANIDFENDTGREEEGGGQWRSSRQGGASHTHGDQKKNAFNARTELPLSLQQSFSRGQMGVNYTDTVDFSGGPRRPATSISSIRREVEDNDDSVVKEDRAGTASSHHLGGPRSLPAFRGVLRQAAEAKASYLALEALLHAVEEGGGGRGEEEGGGGGGGGGISASRSLLPFSPINRGLGKASSSSSATASASVSSVDGMSTLIGKVAHAVYN